MKISFRVNKETKNTYRFEEIDGQGNVVPSDSAMIGTVYIQKRAFGDRKPTQIVLELKV